MTCDYCKKPPVANYQKIWVRWAINRSGEYSRLASYTKVYEMNEWDEPVGDDNIHVCRDHEKELLTTGLTA